MQPHLMNMALAWCCQQRTANWSTLQVGRTLRIGGWVKTGRTAGGGDFAFLEVNDGSTFPNLQVRSGSLGAVSETAWRINCSSSLPQHPHSGPVTALCMQLAIRRRPAAVQSPSAACHAVSSNGVTTLQVLVKTEVVDASDALSSLKDVTSTGTCVLIEGQLVKTPEGTKQVRASQTRGSSRQDVMTTLKPG